MKVETRGLEREYEPKEREFINEPTAVGTESGSMCIYKLWVNTQQLIKS
jgi:hypothetical protein